MRRIITIMMMMMIRRASQIIIRDKGVVIPATRRIFQR